ncbi:MAG: 2Fe-2S iron-sulfur cluster-binding protein [Bacteroidales bacterium]|nr:2Fe-2S iron-sulfur cluster-binding protein [Bacteroidales bacterium]
MIDKRETEVAEGSMLIEVIRGMGMEVPSMCYMEDLEHFTSCMVCVVKDRKSGKIIPSCSMAVEEGMDIISEDEEIREARRSSLELLLSEHVGDCEAPCQVTCPAHMDIPLMNRLLAAGKFHEALVVVKRDIALPSVLGRICPAPCEGACRRKTIDEPVSICLLKRYAGDFDMEADLSWRPEKEGDTGKNIAIIGAGPAGLAAAYHLALKGHRCRVFDRNRKAGGSLCKEVSSEDLPAEVLQREIDTIAAVGVEFSLETAVDAAEFGKLQRSYDAVVVATGKGESGVAEWGLPLHSKGVEADGKTYRVGGTGVFVVGSALKPSKMAIRVLGQGKGAAFSVDQYLRNQPVMGEPFLFNSRFGKLLPAEFAEYLKESVEGNRLEPARKGDGLSKEQVKEEAARCLHCDCRDLHKCRLRLYSDAYGADQKRFKSEERQLVTKQDQHQEVIYEPSKCIKCGICVRLTEKHQEEFGFTFIGRGFEVVVGIPFHENLAAGLKKVALEVADACPTGAISRKAENI